MNIAERKIKKAFDEAAQLHRECGNSPDDAIIKAAEDCELNPEMVRRVVEMFNIAKTNSTLKVASDKTDSFPIAHVDVILKKAFVDSPLLPKEAAKMQERTVSASSGFSLKRKVVEDTVEKTAAPLDELREWIRQANSLVLQTGAELSKLGQDVLFHELEAHKAMTDLVDYFSCSNNSGKFAEFEGEIFSEYGETLKPSLDIIYQLSGLDEPRWKGSVKLGSAFIVPTPAHRSFDRLMDHTRGYHAAANEKAAYQEKTTGELESIHNIIMQLGGVDPHKKAFQSQAVDMLDFEFSKKKAASPHVKGWTPLTAVNAPLSVAHKALDTATGSDSAIPGAGTYGAMTDMHRSTAAGMAGAAHEHALKQHYQKPKDESDMEMDNVKRQTILQKILAEDEILGKQDPKMVEGAYNALLHLAPDVTLNHGVTQAVLRQAVASQAVDPFTAKQLSDLQLNITKNKLLSKGSLLPSGT